MTFKNIIYTAAITTVLSSCVSGKIHEDLQDKYEALKVENASLMSQLDNVEGASSIGLEQIKEDLQKCKSDKTQLAMDLAGAQAKYDKIKGDYDALEANSSENLSENLDRNRALLTELEAKERILNTKEADLIEQEKVLKRAQNNLDASAARVLELEGIIAAKEAQMDALKNAISAALTSFEGNGLTVEQREGKVYVSMENKLLFESGSWDVNSRGREAVVALGKVLGDNKEIAVLIEGHTDNVPYGEKGLIKDNWDLSTKRATAIVAILTENNNIPKENLTAAGRGEYAPIASNNTSEGKAKNRRIEVVLTPKLDEISKLLNE
ncbi:outer membrane protein, OmpA family [unidentified eubacterium SCB49]|nr:outer membrane protein, OmpA family [unidentified eubacterium SCB49]